MPDQPEHSNHSQPEGSEQRSLSGALWQLAQDAKDVGLGVAASAAYDALKKQPPGDK